MVWLVRVVEITVNTTVKLLERFTHGSRPCLWGWGGACINRELIYLMRGLGVMEYPQAKREIRGPSLGKVYEFESKRLGF